MAPTESSARALSVLVGGVAQLYQGDLDFGRVALERLAERQLEQHVLVEDLSYGAVAVTQRLEEIQPAELVLVGAAARGRRPGTIERRRIRPLELPAGDSRQAVAEAVTGYVTIDLVIEVASALGALPARTVAVELEPVQTEVSEHLSPQAEAGIGRAVELALAEARRAPLLALADTARAELVDERLDRTPAVRALEHLLSELERVDEEGSWGDAFLLGDVLRSRIAAGETACDMTHLDWGLWWGLVEELERLQGVEEGPPPGSPSGGSSSSTPRF